MVRRVDAPRGTFRALLLLAAASSIAASCSSGHRPSASHPSAGGSMAAAGMSPSTTTAAQGPAAGTATTTRNASGASGSTATTRAGASTSGTVSGSNGPIATGGTSAVAPAAPGTYAMDQSGTLTYGPSAAPLYKSSEPPNGTLVVDAAQANGTQIEHRYISSGGSPANTELQYTPSGPVIISTTEGGQGASFTCTFSPPIAAPPWPPAAGKSFSSQGSCGNGTTVVVSGKITGSQTARLADGETFTVWVIDSTLSMKGQIDATGTQVDWWAPALRLSVHEQVQVNGTYNGQPFSLNSTSDLASSHPS